MVMRVQEQGNGCIVWLLARSARDQHTLDTGVKKCLRYSRSRRNPTPSCHGLPGLEKPGPATGNGQAIRFSHSVRQIVFLCVHDLQLSCSTPPTGGLLLY